MSAAARHTGLPFVPKPAANELLGSWLLRIAQLYGLGLATLLSRLGAQPAGDARLPHWFAIGSSSVSLDALSAASRLSGAALTAMAPPACRSRRPEELGACTVCLAQMVDAGHPITWNRNWMSPLAAVCSIHGTWLTPVATRTLASVRHAGDFGSVVHHVAATQALFDDEPECAGDAMWLQGLCSARTDVKLPWGRTRPHDLIRIVNALAREVISASDSRDSAVDLTADRRPESVKYFAIETADAQRVGLSLPTRLRHRQGVLARVAHVLRLAPEARTFHSSWSAPSVERLASMRDWSEGALAWVCPKAAVLLRRQNDLQREFSISPRYFKAHAVLLASFR